MSSALSFCVFLFFSRFYYSWPSSLKHIQSAPLLILRRRVSRPSSPDHIAKKPYYPNPVSIVSPSPWRKQGFCSYCKLPSLRQILVDRIPPQQGLLLCAQNAMQDIICLGEVMPCPRDGSGVSWIARSQTKCSLAWRCFKLVLSSPRSAAAPKKTMRMQDTANTPTSRTSIWKSQVLG